VKRVQVIWSGEALNDLETIYDFLAENSQPAAQRIVESILSRTRQLESFPESGAKQQAIKLGDKEYRYLVEGNYKSHLPLSSRKSSGTCSGNFDTRSNPEEMKV
jgi:plasmid stabilization system protein ParE